MVLRMGKTLEARTMPGSGRRQNRQGGETDHPHGRGQGPSPDFARSHQAMERVVGWELERGGGPGASDCPLPDAK